MKMSMAMTQQTLPLLDINPTGRRGTSLLNPWWQKEKVVVVMGATGTGKSRLSVDIATRFPAEIINSDKMQIYEGLDIVTNKVTDDERCGVPHHLLGVIDPNAEFTAHDFCKTVSYIIGSIAGHGRVPVIVGGSNSYIEALMDEKDYDCCFLWVDVAMPELRQFVSGRVDKMVENGMVEEVKKLFDPKADYNRGIRKAIGVPEFDMYFQSQPYVDGETRARMLREAVDEVKENTCKLAYKQLGKIQRLRNVKKWEIHRLDATEVFRRRGEEADEAWEELVVGPSAMIVRQFLYNGSEEVSSAAGMRVTCMGNAIAAAIH